MSGVKGRSGGHNKKTLREKQIKGERKDRLPEKSIDSIPERIELFRGLGSVGKAIFNHYDRMLFENGTLSATDGLMFNQLCRKYEDWYAMSNKCRRDGRYISKKDEEGNIVDVKLLPWAKLEKEYFDQLKGICREFGLSPVSRGGIEKIERGKSNNPLLELLK